MSEVDNEFTEFAGSSGDFPVGTAQGIAAIALSMAMKYHSFSTVQDGVLYQQYKMEGKNMETLSIHMVFETAMQIEKHLISANDRISNLIMDALTVEITGDDAPSDAAVPA